MTRDDLMEVGKELAAMTREKMAAALGEFTGRLKALEDRLAAVPEGREGPPGRTGDRGESGPQGLKGDQGERGADGASVTIDQVRTLIEASMATYMLEWERHANAEVTRFLDRMPPPTNGADGADGLGFDEITVEHDGERTFAFVGRSGDRVKQLGAATVPVVLDRGVYTVGKTYDKGDGVTWGGSFWIAQEPTSAKPGESGPQSRAWRLAVKKGSEGKAGPQGAQGLKGDRGEKGDKGGKW
jgi:integrin beta 3